MDNQEEKNIEEKEIEEIVEDNDEENELDEQEVFTYTVDNNNLNNDYNKDEDNKSFIYIIGGLVILVIIIVTIIVLVNKKTGKTESFSSIEKKMVEAAQKYYNDKKEELPKDENESVSITSEALIKNGYLKPFEEMKKDGEKCTGNVNVYKSNENYAYFPILNCGKEYKSSKLNEKIIDDNLVTTKDGLYKIGDEYIFRGENPNNNVKMDGKKWKIIKINPSGTIKLILISDKYERTAWDDRYNNEKSTYFGKNDFKLSRILEKLNEEYEKNTYVKSENKELLVKENWCIGKINEKNVPISSLNICNDTYSDLYIGMINVKEILQPSLDENCKNIFDLSCTNYNYLARIDTGWTINVSNETTYSVVSSDGGAISIDRASTYNSLVPVININSNVLYKSGNGTEKDPYTIGK